jgi:hypothetical protein
MYFKEKKEKIPPAAVVLDEKTYILRDGATV